MIVTAEQLIARVPSWQGCDTFEVDVRKSLHECIRCGKGEPAHAARVLALRLAAMTDRVAELELAR